MRVFYHPQTKKRDILPGCILPVVVPIIGLVLGLLCHAQWLFFTGIAVGWGGLAIWIIIGSIWGDPYDDFL